MDAATAAPFVLLFLGIAAMWTLYRMAMDPKTRLRDGQGRRIDPTELEDDEPPDLRSDR